MHMENGIWYMVAIRAKAIVCDTKQYLPQQ